MRMFQKAFIFLWEKIEKILFPQCCLICGKLTDINIICNKCERIIYKNQICTIENKDKEKYYFEKHAYMFLYKNEIRKLIIDYKFNDKAYLYKLFSENIIKNEKICGILKKYDIIIPVPIHKKRKRQRGYNQSELISKEIANYIKSLNLENNIIQKVKNNIAQSTLSKKQRKTNVENVYKIAEKEKIENKNIVLFDDIYTTGSTVNVISKILKENGAKKIIVLTIAKD